MSSRYVVLNTDDVKNWFKLINKFTNDLYLEYVDGKYVSHFVESTNVALIHVEIPVVEQHGEPFNISTDFNNQLNKFINNLPKNGLFEIHLDDRNVYTFRHGKVAFKIPIVDETYIQEHSPSGFTKEQLDKKFKAKITIDMDKDIIKALKSAVSNYEEVVFHVEENTLRITCESENSLHKVEIEPDVTFESDDINPTEIILSSTYVEAILPHMSDKVTIQFSNVAVSPVVFHLTEDSYVVIAPRIREG